MNIINVKIDLSFDNNIILIYNLNKTSFFIIK